jgi:hypothetical protein
MRGNAWRVAPAGALSILAFLLACSSFQAEDVRDGADAGGADATAESDAADGGATFPSGPPVVAVATQPSPTRIALDATNVYWRNAGEPNDAGMRFGEINALSRSAGGAPLQLARDFQFGDGLAIDPGYVYWGVAETCGSPVAIHRVKKTGGAVEGVFPSDCAFDNVVDLAVDGADVFFVYAAGEAVGRTRLQSPPAKIAAGKARALAVDKLSVYYSQPTTGSLVRIDKSDPSNTVQIFATQQRAVAVVTDETTVYWISENNTVARLDRNKPSTAPVILANDEASPTAIAITSTHVLWTTSADGSIRRVAKTGGTPETLATKQDDPVAIAGDDAGIYWLNRGTGTVMRIGR